MAGVPGRPEPIPKSLWDQWTGDQEWKKQAVAFLHGHFDEEFTAPQIKRGTGLQRPLLSTRISSLARAIDRSRAAVQVKWRQEGLDKPPYRLYWRMEKREPLRLGK